MGADGIVLCTGRAQLHPQGLDMRIDGAVGTVGITVPAAIHQLRTTEDGARALIKAARTVFIDDSIDEGIDTKE